MKRLFMLAATLLSMTVHTAGYAQQEAEEILNAVVGVRTVIPEDAVTAPLLGTERSGSGVLIDSDGYILTIGYLLLEAKTIEVVGPEERVIEAAFIGYDYDTGFGLLKAAEPLNVRPMKLGSSSGLKEGDPALITSHQGAEAVSGVRVVSRGEFVGYWEYLLENAIFTIPPYENYGGAALMGPAGDLLGIGSLFTRVEVAGFGTATANMFVPIDLLKPILNDLKTLGRSRQPQKPWLGVHTEEAHGRIFITRILAAGPAEKSNLQVGDLILKVGNQPVSGHADFYRKLWALGDAGVTVPLSILRGTEIQAVTVQSTDRYQFIKPRPESGAKRKEM